MGRFDKLKSEEGMKISDVLRICSKCNTKEEAVEVLKEYEELCESPEIARTNLGYIFGYSGSEERKKLYSLFPLSHPIFGSVFGRGGVDDKIVDAIGGIIGNIESKKNMTGKKNWKR